MQCSRSTLIAETQLSVKIAPALQVELEEPSVSVAHLAFRTTKPHS